MWWSIVVIMLLKVTAILGSHKAQYLTLEEIQNYNIKTLTSVFHLGWTDFCEAVVDEAVISLFPGSDPSDSTINLITESNSTISLPIKFASKVPEFGINPNFTTLIYVNAFPQSELYDVREELVNLQQTLRDVNIIIVDFAKDMVQLYNSIKHNVFVQAYSISNLISVLAAHGVNRTDVVLIGHSVGANIAALAADLHRQDETAWKIGTLIAIDPAIMCSQEEVYVNSDVAEKVVVVHGENDSFGIPHPLGTVDIYPNGNGLKLQPGCETKMCSHLYPFKLFLDAVVEGSIIKAVKCDSWSNFRRGRCDYSSVVTLGLDFDNVTNGRYYCLTRDVQPYGLGYNGLIFKKKYLKKKESVSGVKTQ